MNPVKKYFSLMFLVLILTFISIESFALPEYPLISEAVIDVTGTEADSEMVELYNPTGAAINIGGWDIGYKTATGSSWSSVATIPAGETIPAYGYYLIGGDKISPTPDKIDTSLGFSASGGHIALRNSSNQIIDKIGYGNANDPEGDTIAAPGIDKSLERKSNGSDTQGNGYETNNNSADFTIRNYPQPQNKYSQIEIPVYFEGSISISNNFSKITDTANIIVIDADKNNNPDIAETFSVTITSSADTSGITIILKEINTNADTFDAVTNGAPLGLMFGASNQSTNKIGVRALGDTILVSYSELSPNAVRQTQAVFSGVNQIKINEIMFDPSGTDAGNEWVELYNSSNESVDITGWVLTDEDATERIVLPALNVPAHCFVVVYIDQTGVNDTDFLDSVAHIYSGETTTVSLANTKDEISLYVSESINSKTIIDFSAYSVDGSIDAADYANALAAGIWTENDKINAAALSESQTLILSPDGDDNNFSTDWSIDATPTQGFSNGYIILPSAPVITGASAGNGFVILNWSAAIAGEYSLAGYNIYRKQTAGEYSKIN